MNSKIKTNKQKINSDRLSVSYMPKHANKQSKIAQSKRCTCIVYSLSRKNKTKQKI